MSSRQPRTRREIVAFMRCHEIRLGRLIDEGYIAAVPRVRGKGKAEAERDAAMDALFSRSRAHFEQGQAESGRLLRRFNKMNCRPQCRGPVCRRLRTIPGMRAIMNELRRAWVAKAQGE